MNPHTKYSESETFEHTKKLAIAYADALTFLNSYGYGEWGVDQYRPFGNSSAQIDILEICDIEPEGDEDGEEYYSDEQCEYADYLYKERLGVFLKEAIPAFAAITTALVSH